ncbi:MAG TPA: chorismate mutase [Candidatus Acidoferrales bacterium]|nr:chorismate mutase [Candidatus Acidoferrales bacterium]
MPSPTTIAAVRGAISVPSNDAAAIRIATSRLVTELIARNGLTPERIVSAIFTATPDLNADFPAHAARRLGWTDAPLLCATEIGVPGAPPRIVRVLVTVRDVPRGTRLVPVYLDDAVSLRQDLAHPSDATATPGAPAATQASAVAATAPRAGRGAGEPRRIAIVGLGQIGGSIGLALTAGRWHRVGFDRNARARREAKARGVIDEAASSLAGACRAADLVVLATPVDTLPALIARAARALPRGAALLDTGSTRAGITEALAAAAHEGVRACGGHPIAGGEGRGLAAAKAGLFAGAPFALLPLGRTLPPAVRALVRDVGARPLVVTPSEHDAALARTSHLPYVLACALQRVGGAAARRRLAGPGYASATRLAASDPRMARAYVRANRANVRAAWRQLRREVARELKDV